MTKRGAIAALSYMACAVLLVMFNKAALSSYSFPCANVITLFQMVCSSSILYAMRRWGIITFTIGEPWMVPDKSSPSLVPLTTLLQTLPLSLTYLLYMVASMESVRGVNVPMYTTLRRTTVVFTITVEYLLTGQKYPPSVFSSVFLIVFGAFLAGARDMSYDSYGYAIVLVSNISTAIYLATIARLGKSSGLNSFGLMWCNGNKGVMLLSCIMAFFLNYCIFLNTTLNSALTQTMCGNLKDLLTVGLGWMIFGGLPFDMLNVVGQCLGFLGSGLYAYSKLKGR
ncbi:unnamed protein product [Spirodela intermedia]|uniref:Sugar phosphate transporter domain-containing protein n=1 Tax=Spirodela intermedia TaxID=51605 RepID=A0ABN7EB06_SPIIN|nr:unnamed protein product [Spirodela intermedia]